MTKLFEANFDHHMFAIAAEKLRDSNPERAAELHDRAMEIDFSMYLIEEEAGEDRKKTYHESHSLACALMGVPAPKMPKSRRA